MKSDGEYTKAEKTVKVYQKSKVKMITVRYPKKYWDECILKLIDECCDSDGNYTAFVKAAVEEKLTRDCDLPDGYFEEQKRKLYERFLEKYSDDYKG